MENTIYRGIGIMSGTSLDGLDLAFCEFAQKTGSTTWNYRILQAQTVAYDSVWKDRLDRVYAATAEQYFTQHSAYGRFISEKVNGFVKEFSLEPGFIASHGHTVFHRPELGFSAQIGCGATIAAHTNITTICDFRSLDVALGGQGAPLVPVGDALLFQNYAACLNIGGIANISFDANGARKAFDTCVANMAFNYLSKTQGKEFDEAGQIAHKGKVNNDLLLQLNKLSGMHGKKSIGREFFEKEFLPVLNRQTLSTEDKMATCSEHSAQQIAGVLNAQTLSSVLITGGGAYNQHLINRIKLHYKGNVIIPDDHTVQFKEALIFAFLGVLRLNEEINTLKSVTGAKANSVGGAVYLVR